MLGFTAPPFRPVHPCNAVPSIHQLGIWMQPSPVPLREGEGQVCFLPAPKVKPAMSNEPCRHGRTNQAIPSHLSDAQGSSQSAKSQALTSALRNAGSCHQQLLACWQSLSTALTA